MSRYWFEQARPNDLLRLRGPLGSFWLRDVAGMDLILLATGTGIAPIKAMLERLGQRPGARSKLGPRVLGWTHPNGFVFEFCRSAGYFRVPLPCYRKAGRNGLERAAMFNKLSWRPISI